MFYKDLKIFLVCFIFCVFTTAPGIYPVPNLEAVPVYLFDFPYLFFQAHTSFVKIAGQLVVCPKTPGCCLPLRLCYAFPALWDSLSLPPFLSNLTYTLGLRSYSLRGFHEPLHWIRHPQPFLLYHHQYILWALCLHMTLKLFPHVSISLPGWQTPRGGPNEKCWDHMQGEGRVTKSLPKFQQAASFHVGPMLLNINYHEKHLRWL